MRDSINGILDLVHEAAGNAGDGNAQGLIDRIRRDLAHIGDHHFIAAEKLYHELPSEETEEQAPDAPPPEEPPPAPESPAKAESPAG
jgi:hypothetical protein